MRYKIQLFLIIATGLKLVLSEGEHFAILAQRQMQNDISIADVQIKFIANRYQDLIDVILYRQQRTFGLIQEVNQNLILKEIIGPAYKTCIQKYKPEMYTKWQAEGKFNECHTVSEEKNQKFLLDADTPFRSARNIANIQWPMSVESCRNTNGTPPEECVIAKAETYFWAFNENMNDVQDKVEMNHGLAAVIARNAMECSFFAEKRILMKMGGMLQLIDICLADMQLPPISGELLYD